MIKVSLLLCLHAAQFLVVQRRRVLVHRHVQFGFRAAQRRDDVMMIVAVDGLVDVVYRFSLCKPIRNTNDLVYMYMTTAK